MSAETDPTLASLDPAFAEVLQRLRDLQDDMKALRADKAARENETAERRRALSDRTLLVTEDELPAYIPFTRRQIRRLREEGKLPFIPDPLGGKKIIYNLRAVEATLLAGAPRTGPLVREVDWSKISVAA